MNIRTGNICDIDSIENILYQSQEWLGSNKINIDLARVLAMDGELYVTGMPVNGVIGVQKVWPDQYNISILGTSKHKRNIIVESLVKFAIDTYNQLDGIILGRNSKARKLFKTLGFVEEITPDDRLYYRYKR
jgi:hypothetical protein